MRKRLALGLLCAGGALAGGLALADSDTRPDLAGMKECQMVPGPHRTAKFSFTVTETGTATDIRVIESSGDSRADERAVTCLAHDSYRPATHNGVPVAATMTRVMQWGSADGADEETARHAFRELERDADRRCYKLYPPRTELSTAEQPISLVAVARLASGEIQTKIVQSAGTKLDEHAVKCVVMLVQEHTDLPAVFQRTITVDWAHSTRRPGL